MRMNYLTNDDKPFIDLCPQAMPLEERVAELECEVERLSEMVTTLMLRKQ